MILTDTSVWVDHLRSNDPAMASLLHAGQILIHPAVIGEIALGSLRHRKRLLQLLAQLPAAIPATDAEVLQFIETHRLFGTGVGYVDAHVLASVRLTPDAVLWTRDKRLLGAAEKLGVIPLRRDIPPSA